MTGERIRAILVQADIKASVDYLRRGEMTMTTRAKLNTQQVRDAGQYYVAAEISRQGGYAVVTPGNRQGIDILANDVAHKRFIGIQAKTKNHPGRWVASTRDGRPPEEPSDETTFWVMVDLNGTTPEYYVVPAWSLQNTIYTNFQDYLAKHGGQRPRNPDSTDWSIHVADVKQWKGRWDVLGIF